MPTTTIDPAKMGVWNRALEKLRTARELHKELLKISPNSQFDAEGARGNGAARAALNAAIDIIQHSPPTSTMAVILDGHWAGLMEGAVKIITAVEMEMYDPRAHPERYK